MEGDTSESGRTDRRIRVVVVDDGSSATRTATLLDRQRRSFSVEPIADPAVALERVRTGTVDCVVTEYGVRGDTDFGFVEQVREHDADLPLVLFTDGPCEQFAGRAIAAGVSDYLQKPEHAESDRYDVLASRIETLLDGRRPDRRDPMATAGFPTLVESSSDIIAIFARDGTNTFVSPSIERILGYDPEEFTGTKTFSYVHEDDRERVVSQFEAAMREPGATVRVEFRFPHADGSWRTIEGVGRNRLDDPEVGGFVVNYRDVTHRRRREQELEMYEQFVNAAGDVIYALDDEFRFVMVNDGFERLLGVSEADVLGEHGLWLTESGAVSREDFDRGAEAVLGLLSADDTSVTRFESVVHTADGTIYAENIASPFPLENGRYGFVVIVRDISARKAYERELERQNERLDAFASVVSHDLRNPLAVITSGLQLARETGADEDFDRVENAARRMEDLIDDLLSLARSGREVGTTRPVDVERAARSAWAVVDAPDATLDVTAADVVFADPDRLRQLLENLFRNAVEHAGPAVAIRVEARPGGFAVTDDGPGIAAADRDRVFERGVTTSDGGTGFGLSIVRTIVDAHGWSIRIAESDDGGAAFEISGVD